jgi:hypothetical protein
LKQRAKLWLKKMQGLAADINFVPLALDNLLPLYIPSRWQTFMPNFLQNFLMCQQGKILIDLLKKELR